MTSPPSTIVTIKETKDWLNTKATSQSSKREVKDKWVTLDVLEEISKRVLDKLNECIPRLTEAATMFNVLLHTHGIICKLSDYLLKRIC